MPVLLGLIVFMLGLAVGLFGFKIKQRWCPDCGCVMLPGGKRQAGVGR